MARGINFVIRTRDDPRSSMEAVRRILRDVEPDATLERLEPLADPVWASVAQPRFATAVVVTFATLSVVLAAIGLYGVLAYAVFQRRRELGIRATLGALRMLLLRLVLREGIAVTTIGIVVGLIAAAIATRLMSAMLFGVTPRDALSFAIAPAVLLPIAAVASLVPASRAARVNPVDALRAEN
jgi:ABC-type antimicrobial peptide transport system permease subunit